MPIDFIIFLIILFGVVLLFCFFLWCGKEINLSTLSIPCMILSFLMCWLFSASPITQTINVKSVEINGVDLLIVKYDDLLSIINLNEKLHIDVKPDTEFNVTVLPSQTVNGIFFHTRIDRIHHVMSKM